MDNVPIQDGESVDTYEKKSCMRGGRSDSAERKEKFESSSSRFEVRARRERLKKAKALQMNEAR